jgi:Protein of unknown function (DUF2867)
MLAGRARSPKHPSLRRPAPWLGSRAGRNRVGTFTTRLTTADRLKSLAPAGTREGLFRVVYRFENDQLLELINRTAHAAALSALVETANAYRFYFGVYVCSVSRFTPIYMALIDPFRKLVVYPSLLRTVRAKWNKTFGTA